MAFSSSVSLKDSIATQLFRAVFGLYCVVAVTVTLIHMTTEYHYTKSRVSEELRFFENSFGPILATAVWNLDRDQLQDIMTGISEAPIIVGIKIEYHKNTEILGAAGIINQDGETVEVSSNGRQKPYSNQAFTQLFSYQFPILYSYRGKSQEVGRATLYSNSSIVFQRVQLGFVFLVVNSIIKGIALWLIFLWIGRILLLRPLSMLTSATKQINFDDLTPFRVDIKTSAQNELKVLENAFTLMTENLSSAKAQLLDFNRQLEKQVHERTQELQKINTRLHEEITEHRQAEEALIAERNRGNYILEGTNAGTWDWNVQTGEVTLNKRWAEIMGRTLEELEPIDIQTWTKNIHPDDLPNADAQLKLHFAGKQNYYDVEFRQPHKNGNWVWVNARGKVIEWAKNGKPLRMSGTHLDISKHKQAEEELRGKEKIESIIEMAGTVCHELSQPMQIITGYSEILLMDISEDNQISKKLLKITKQIERIKTLLQRLNTITRYKPKAHDSETQMIDLKNSAEQRSPKNKTCK